MITLTREEAQQVLDAFEGVFEGDDKGAEFWTVYGGTFEAVYCMDAMRLLRAKIAEPQREWQGLTGEEMFDCLAQTDGEAKRLPLGFKWFAEAIEAKLKEKNT